MDEQSDLFSQLFVRCLESDRTTPDVELEVLIDKLLKLDYGKRIFAVTTKISGEVLNHFALHTNLFSTKNEFLLNKFFQLAIHLTSSQEIILESSIVNNLLSKIISIWNYCMNNPVSFHTLLDAVAAITYQNGPYLSAENMTLLLTNGENSLPGIAKGGSVNMDVKRTAVQCMAGLCMMCDNGDHLANENLEICMKLFVSELQNLTVNTPYDIPTCRMIFTLAKGLNYILNCDSNVYMSSIGPLLAVLKKFMIYGLPGHSVLSAPDELQPVPIPELHPKQETATPSKSQSKKKKRKPKSRSKFKDPSPADVMSKVEQMTHDKGQGPGFSGDQVQFRPTWGRVTSSESEYSDTEGAQKAKLRSFLSKIRHMCLSVLYLTVKKTDKHTMLGYWSSFLPESPAIVRNSASLFTSFKEDMAPKCRAAALGVVSGMLEGSRWYLAFAAEETGSPSQHQTSSFVPFSVYLAASIREIHKQLLSASGREQSTMALTQLLKTLSTLVSNTPYRKMKPGLLVKVCRQARYFLTTSRDVSVRVASLALIGSIVSTSAPLGEVASILTDPTTSSTVRPSSGNHTPVEYRSVTEQNEAPTSVEKSWLIDQCINLGCSQLMTSVPSSTQFYEPGQPETPYLLRVEALQTLAKITKGYLPVVKNYIIKLGDVISECLKDQSSPIRINGGKILEELGSSMLQMMKTSPSNTIEDEVLSVWNQLLSGPLQKAMQDHTTPILQGKGCDSLSTVSPAIFVKLPKNLQIMCLTLLLGFTSDENAVVRAPAVRALGVYVMFPSLREDVAFLEDVAATVLRLLDDPLLVVRANAAWSLGNLTDTLVINQEIRPQFKDDFQNSVLLELFNKAVSAANNKAKVVFNMMRVLGNLLRYTDGSHVANIKFKTVMLKSTRILSQMVGEGVIMKVCWNACTACSNVLRNQNLPLGESEWTDHMYQALSESVATCKNFKVRIKAALALSTTAKREHYGSKFIDVFACLIRGFEDSDVVADFAEFKFKDTLQEQLCTTLIHLASLVKSDDLPAICAILPNKTEDINQHLATYHKKLTQKLETKTDNYVNGDQSSMTAHLGESSDPVEEYIVAKQLTPQEKLDHLKTAICHINGLVILQDMNENCIAGDETLKSKAGVDRSLLRQLFTLPEMT